MKISILTLAAAISLAVIACSDSPTSHTGDSSSSVVPSSSSGGVPIGGACEHSGEDFGFRGLFSCTEVPINKPNLIEYETDCELDGDIWVDACPSGEKATCIDDEDEDEKDVLYKIYPDGFFCGDFLMKNADGHEDIIPKGGACFIERSSQLAMCTEYPELSTGIIKLSCAELGAPFVNQCSKANLTCYDPKASEPQEKMIFHFYGEKTSFLTCGDFDMEEYRL